MPKSLRPRNDTTAATLPVPAKGIEHDRAWRRRQPNHSRNEGNGEGIEVTRVLAFTPASLDWDREVP